MNITEEECKECGLCCWFDPETITGDKSLIMQEDGFCINHDKEEGCKIYTTRPQACRDYKRGGDWCLTRREKFADKLKTE